MKDISEWYNDEKPPVEQVKTVSIEKEIESIPEPEEQEDHVLKTEFENCIKAVGLSEFLRNQLGNYIAMTQVPDLEGFKKDHMKSEIKTVMQELSKTIGEL